MDGRQPNSVAKHLNRWNLIIIYYTEYHRNTGNSILDGIETSYHPRKLLRGHRALCVFSGHYYL